MSRVRRRSPRDPGRQPLRTFAAARLSSFAAALDRADNAEKVRAVLALTLVGVLVALQFAPSGDKELTTAAETLAIAVVAFYFGLHSGNAPAAGGAPVKPPPPEHDPSGAFEGGIPLSVPPGSDIAVESHGEGQPGAPA